MSTFKNIQGKNIRSYENNAPNPVAGEMWYNRTELKLKGVVATSAWSSSSPMATGREFGSSGIGTQAANIVAGGYAYPPGRTANTEEYNGSGWENITNVNAVKYVGGGAGSVTAGLVFGGSPGPGSYGGETEEYNGSSWSEQNDMSTGRNLYNAGAGGPSGQTAGLAAGGYNGSNSNATEEYDGSSWTNGGNLGTARRASVLFGTQTAGTLATGYVSGNVSTVENYDGSSWTTGTSTNVAKSSAASSAMSQTSAVVFGGSPNLNTNESWDGTSWSVAPTLATGRAGINGAGTGSAAIAASGFTTPPDASPGITEEFTTSANIITAAAWASGGNLNTARNGGNGTATNSAADTGLTFGGNYPSGTDNSEEYNGTTWAEGNNLPQAISLMGGAGTQTAGLSFTGRLNPGSRIDDTYEYDGTSWGSGGNYGADQAYTSGAGTQTAALGVAGETPPGTDLTTSYEYDGSSWTAGNACNVPGYSGLVFGTSAGAILACLSGPPTGLESESYDGTNWTAGPTTVITQTQGGASGTYPIGLIFGGSATAPSTSTQGWDGTAWSTRPSLSTGRRASGSGVTAQGLAQGGETPGSPTSNATEEFTPETTAVNIVDITTS